MMNTVYRTIIILAVLSVGGCGSEEVKPSIRTGVRVDADTTIGSLTEVFSLNPIVVEGYGIVAGLAGTGSAECPPAIRGYLTKYIRSRLLAEQKINIDEFIDAHDTAVVRIRGMMPQAVVRNERFDVLVEPLTGDQTTSLENGWLYEAQLKPAGRVMTSTRLLATAAGPVYIDKIEAGKPGKGTGYVLAGGAVLDEYPVRLALREADYKIASAIRNRLNQRFGADTANAVSDSQLLLKVPQKYKRRKERFVAVVAETYLLETDGLIKERVREHVRRLAVSAQKAQSEFALEAIGAESVKVLSSLLNSANSEVRLRSARCMLNIGSDSAIDTLIRLTNDGAGSLRIEALEAIADSAARSTAAALARAMLDDEDVRVRLAAYEQLRKLDDVSLSRRFVGDFELEQIGRTVRAKTIFVSRSGRPRIAILAGRLECRQGVFVQSDDKSITINASAGQGYVSLVREVPKRQDLPPVRLKSSFLLSDIIETLCTKPSSGPGPQTQGLGVSYCQMTALLKKMCERGAVKAEFYAGELPKLQPIVK